MNKSVVKGVITPKPIKKHLIKESTHIYPVDHYYNDIDKTLNTESDNFKYFIMNEKLQEKVDGTVKVNSDWFKEKEIDIIDNDLKKYLI